MNTLKNRLRSLAGDGVLVIYFIFVLFPILWMVLTSFKRTDELYTTRFLFHPTLESYKVILNLQTEFVQGTGAFRTDFPKFFMNSVILSVGAVLLSLLVGVPAAYALARFRFKGKESLAFTFLSFRFAPEFAVIIPLSIIYRKLGLYNTYFGIIWILLVAGIHPHPVATGAAGVGGFGAVGLRLCLEQLRVPDGPGRLGSADGYRVGALLPVLCAGLLQPHGGGLRDRVDPRNRPGAQHPALPDPRPELRRRQGLGRTRGRIVTWPN
jgi:hypothetical protein